MAIKGLGKTAGGFVSNTIKRLTGAKLSPGAESVISNNQKNAARWNRASNPDWRLMLTVPHDSPFRQTFFESDLMSPLRETGGVVFPLTPTVMIQHGSNYTPMAVTHNNFPFYAYQNSETASMTIVAEFPVQNSKDAHAWVAALHFFRTVTKMFFGGDESYRGNPPPILKMNGYGDYVFKNVPVVVTNFTVELTNNVDYIGTSQVNGDKSKAQQAIDNRIADLKRQVAKSGRKFSVDEFDTIYDQIIDEAQQALTTPEYAWAPTNSIFSIAVQPVYSRETVKKFSLQKFVNGGLTTTSELGDNYSDDVGFI